MSKKVYISGALTGVGDANSLKRFYEDIGELCEDFGLNPYIPHQHTDPETHPQVSPREVFRRDEKQVGESDLIIAYVGIPSLGVGSEIMSAAKEGRIPLILLHEKGKQISRMARGNPAVIDRIAFTDYNDALRQLQRGLARIFFKIHFREITEERGLKQTILGVPDREISKRLKADRELHDKKVQEIAERLQEQGWKVRATLPGHALPRPIGRYKRVLDIEATKAETTKLIEVETLNTLKVSRKRLESFKKSAARRENTTFEVILAI